MTYKKEPIEFLAEILASEDLELPCDDFNDENGEEWDFCSQYCSSQIGAGTMRWMRWARWKARKEAKR